MRSEASRIEHLPDCKPEHMTEPDWEGISDCTNCGLWETTAQPLLKYSVGVNLAISVVVETRGGRDRATDIAAEMLSHGQIVQRIQDGNYIVTSIETEGEVP